MSENSEGMARPEKKSVWNSLEVAKLIVGIATPLMLFLLGQQIASAERERQQAAALNERSRAEAAAQFERVTSKRVELWDQLGPKLNDIYAYLLYVGHWKELTAKEIIQRKREADKLVYAYRPFFSDDFFEAYKRFMNSSFQTYNKMGSDAQPRTSSVDRNGEGIGLVTEYENSDCVFLTYNGLLQVVAADFALKVTSPDKRPQTPAEKIKEAGASASTAATEPDLETSAANERCPA